MDLFLNDAYNLEWHNIIKFDDINQKVNCYSTLLLSLYDKHAPIDSKRVTRPPAPWLTTEIKILRKIRNKDLRVKNKMIKNHEYCEERIKNYNKSKNLVNYKTKQAIKNYSNELLSVKEPVKLWQNVNFFGIGKKNVLKINFNFEKLNAQNDFFVDGCNKLSIEDRNLCRIKYIYNLPTFAADKFYFSHIYPEEICSNIKSIKSNAKGNNGITIKMIRQLKNVILPSLLSLFNFSLQNSVVPDSWKESLVIPLPKCTNPVELSDFRPISKINIECELIEKSLLQQMTYYVEKKKQFN
jgi:hypothetical protein